MQQYYGNHCRTDSSYLPETGQHFFTCQQLLDSLRQSPDLGNQWQVVAFLTADSFKQEPICYRDTSKTGLPMGRRHRDVVRASINGPATAVLVAKETGHHFSVVGKQLANLPAVVYIRSLLANRRKRGVSPLP